MNFLDYNWKKMVYVREKYQRLSTVMLVTLEASLLPQLFLKYIYFWWQTPTALISLLSWMYTNEVLVVQTLGRKKNKY